MRVLLVVWAIGLVQSSASVFRSSMPKKVHDSREDPDTPNAREKVLKARKESTDSTRKVLDSTLESIQDALGGGAEKVKEEASKDPKTHIEEADKSVERSVHDSSKGIEDGSANSQKAAKEAADKAAATEEETRKVAARDAKAANAKARKEADAGIEHSQEATQEAGEQAAHDIPKTAGEAKDAVVDTIVDPKKQRMDPVETMRAMMCWGRKNLLEHEACMEWMVDNCKIETTGEGICEQLRKYLITKCEKDVKLACNYAADMHIVMPSDMKMDDPEDSDDDGVKDKDDAFPDNPLEWKDTDGDGVGDNSDRWPNDASCADIGDLCGSKKATTAPAGAPGAAPAAPAPVAAAAPGPAPGPAPSPMGGFPPMDASNALPSQGYDEHSDKLVKHEDQITMTKDWRSEWPRSSGSHKDSINDICAKNPKLMWCKLQKSGAARRQYVISHP